MTQQPHSHDTALGSNLTLRPSDQSTKDKIGIKEDKKAELDTSIDHPNLGKVSSPCMALIIKHLESRPHTCASLVQKIGVYGSSHVSHCLRRLKKAGLIDAVWDFKQVSLVYYKLKLEKDEPSNDRSKS